MAKVCLFELEDEEQDPIEPQELARHTAVRLTQEQVDVKFHNQKFGWDLHIGGETAYTEK